MKATLNIVGLSGDIPRLPLFPANEKTIERLKNLIDDYTFSELWNN